MGKNSIGKLTKVITNDVKKSTLHEVKSALEDIENMLSMHKVTREHILKELALEKTQKLLSYLEQTEKSIFSLKHFAEELNTKKRLLEYETKRTFSVKNLVNL